MLLLCTPCTEKGCHGMDPLSLSTPSHQDPAEMENELPIKETLKEDKPLNSGQFLVTK